MCTAAEIRAMHEDILGRMLDAGWLKRFTFTEGKGFHVTWTPKGALSAIQIKHWYKLLSQGDATTSIELALPLADGRRFRCAGSAADVDEALSVYVRAGLATAFRIDADGVTMQWTDAGFTFCNRFMDVCSELKLGDNPDLIPTLFSVADGWAPDGDTLIVTR